MAIELGRGTMVVAALVVTLALGPTTPTSAAPLADTSTTLVVVDTPRGGTAATQVEVRGWAADPAARGGGGTGVDRVEVYLDGERDAGGTRLGQVTYGLQRPDVAAHLGSQQFLLSGYALRATVSPGPHTIYVYAHPSDQPAELGWAPPKQAALIAGAGGPDVGNPSAAAGGAGSGGVVTWRMPAASGSLTYDLPLGLGSNYPPGPADTGGPISAPAYFGLGFYGGFVPYPDYPLPGGATVVPPGFDFSYGYGYDLYSLAYLSSPQVLFPSSYYAPYYLGRYSRRFGPVYCPVYTNIVC